MITLDPLPEILEKELKNRWDIFTSSSPISAAFVNDNAFLESLKRLFLFSEFALKKCQLTPELLEDLYLSGDLKKPISLMEYTQRLRNVFKSLEDSSELGPVLRMFRNREMIRIAWRDLLGIADLEETLANLSHLAITCVSLTFDKLQEWLWKELGTPTNEDDSPMKVVVLGMGKLGANELNFSSDIDLIFSYPDVGMTTGTEKPVSHEHFFTALCQRFLKVFNEKGPEGFLYRVDMRLRPFGESGPLVMSFNAMEEYYELQGREWERYALIKASVIAGDPGSGSELTRRLKPFIFRRYLDYSVYDSLRDMKRNIMLEVSKKGYKDNIKLGAGGIREIEFFGQIFQLVRGGVEHHLQTRGILPVLEILAADAYIPDQTKEELTAAYVFLRQTENRLQEYADQQTHNLPTDDLRRFILAFSMGFADWESFKTALSSHLKKVHYHFNELLLVDDTTVESDDLDIRLESVWQNLSDDKDYEATLQKAGYEDPSTIVSLLDQFHGESVIQRMSQKSREWLDKLIPKVLKKAGESGQPELVLRRVFELINKIGQRSIYLSLLLENPDALSHLIKLADSSGWIISFLSKHPILLDELLDKRTLFQPPDKIALEKDLFRKLGQIDDDDLEKQLEELIIFKNVNVLHVAAADISGGFQLMKVSDYLSDTAETVLNQVYNLSWIYLVKKYGKPTALVDQQVCDSGFVIIAYGKLGGLELGYGSDLDLVFLNAGIDGDTDGKEMTVDNSQFYARLGQRVVHLLTTNTRAGKLYEIDMRLRPNGNSGILVSKLDAFRDYQMNEAWTWEHQALIRARPICGDPLLIDRFMEIKREIITRPREKAALMEDIQSMRRKMKQEKAVNIPGQFDIKQGDGGLVDIEFIVQYLTLLHASKNDEFARWTDNVRLIGTANKTRILENDTANTLRGAYLEYRSVVHRLSLQEKKAVVPENTFGGIQNEIKRIWDEIFS